jgi:hypothetical protein
MSGYCPASTASRGSRRASQYCDFVKSILRREDPATTLIAQALALEPPPGADGASAAVVSTSREVAAAVESAGYRVDAFTAFGRPVGVSAATSSRAEFLLRYERGLHYDLVVADGTVRDEQRFRAGHLPDVEAYMEPTAAIRPGGVGLFVARGDVVRDSPTEPPFFLRALALTWPLANPPGDLSVARCARLDDVADYLGAPTHVWDVAGLCATEFALQESGRLDVGVRAILDYLWEYPALHEKTWNSWEQRGSEAYDQMRVSGVDLLADLNELLRGSDYAAREHSTHYAYLTLVRNQVLASGCPFPTRAELSRVEEALGDLEWRWAADKDALLALVPQPWGRLVR